MTSNNEFHRLLSVSDIFYLRVIIFFFSKLEVKKTNYKKQNQIEKDYIWRTVVYIVFLIYCCRLI